MSNEMFEVYRDGEPTKRLFLSRENATLYINRQTDGAKYEIKPYTQPKFVSHFDSHGTD